MESVLLDAAGHRRSPATIHAAVAYHVSGGKIDQVVFLNIEQIGQSPG